MKLSITSPSEDVLMIYRRPNYRIVFLWTGATVVSVWWSLSENSMCSFPAFIFMLAAMIDLFTQNEITCKINKVTEEVEYKRKNISGEYSGFQGLQFSLNDIRQLEMHRQTSRWSDTFQICFAVNSTERLPISGKDLSFSECQNYAEQIRMFLGPEIPVVAVD